MTNSRIDVALRKFEALDGEIHFDSTKNYRKNRCKKHEMNRTIVIFRWKMEIYFISWTLDGNIFTRGKLIVKNDD